MTPEQMHAVAAKLRERWPAPVVSMRPDVYLSHQTMNELARAIDATADDLKT